MIFSTFKRLGIVAALCCVFNAQATTPEQAPQPAPRNSQLQTILSITTKAPIGELNSATAQLKSLFEQYPDYRVAKMFYGYGQLFIATDFLAKKNYLRAAEASKLGFFYIDEAAETDEKDWRMRYLRARMDAFVPATNGRCVVALKDTTYLQQDAQVPTALQPMIMLMSARALATCQKKPEAEAAWATLKKQGDEGQRLAQLRDKPAPEWSAEELSNLIHPLAEAPL
ncbi:hypothetical protein ACQKDS_08245 [Serratia sp. NPDC078593]|uniref:hypothetical protein n=1 Tax=unclassified Serratia (in: enterobacteria) TaxID=2647522 RepID=UPI0037D265D7